MDRVDLRLAGDVEDLVDVEVALGGCGRAEQVGLVSETDVRGVAIHLGVDRDRAHAQLLAGADHADGDLAAVGDQDGVEHHRTFRTRDRGARSLVSGRCSTIAGRGRR